MTVVDTVLSCSRTCSQGGDVGCCKPCSLFCHKGHDLVPQRSEFFCDCGAFAFAYPFGPPRPFVPAGASLISKSFLDLLLHESISGDGKTPVACGLMLVPLLTSSVNHCTFTLTGPEYHVQVVWNAVSFVIVAAGMVVMSDVRSLWGHGCLPRLQSSLPQGAQCSSDGPE